MSSPFYKTHSLVKLSYSSLFDLPTPASISVFWNFGFSLSLVLIMQLTTGIMLAMHYTSSVSSAFDSVLRLSQDVNYGWWLRSIHANGASAFFVCVYIHVGRGLYYKSYRLTQVWNTGILMLFTLMGVAFLGYVLPWGQMSYWGATVITNLISAVPYLGQQMVYWVWGAFSVGAATLTRFFALHYLLPFVLMGLVMLHLLFLHQTGSTNPIGCNSNTDKIPFHPYFTSKDILAGWVGMVMLASLSLTSPWLVGDAENFILGNPMVTPVHIKPEWYFLFAYAVLRAIPNKLGGVVGLIMSIAVLFVLPLTTTPNITPTVKPFHKMVVMYLVVVFITLSWIGGNSVEDPYIIIGQCVSVVYFTLFGLMCLPS